MFTWHSVISVSGTKIRYNPLTQELRLVCAKRVPIKLTEFSDFYAIQVLLSSGKADPIAPPNPPRPEWQNERGRKLAPLKKKEVLQSKIYFYEPSISD